MAESSSRADSPEWALLDGAFVDAAAAPLPLGDRGLTLGDAVFTTTGVRDGLPWRLQAHLARLARDTSAMLGLSQASASSLLEPCHARLAELLEANGLASGEAALRICITAGTGPRGLARPRSLEPRCWMTVTPTSLGPRLESPGMRVRRVAAPWLDGLAEAGLTQAKHTARLPWTRAREQDPTAGEVLLCNAAQEVVSASVHNVFALAGEGSTLVTPPVSAGALPGIARAALIEAAHGRGLCVLEQPLGAEVLRQAREVWLTNSLDLIVRLGWLDGSRCAREERAVAAEVAAALCSHFGAPQ